MPDGCSMALQHDGTGVQRLAVPEGCKEANTDDTAAILNLCNAYNGLERQQVVGR